MKGIFGQYGLIIISVFFISLFAVFLSFSVSYNKAVNVKNEIINLIERNDGFNTDIHLEINEHLAEVGYRTTGDCNASNTDDDTVWTGFSMNNTNDNVLRDPNFCMKMTSVANNNPELPNFVYYHVKLFYRVNIPILSEVLSFEITGTTKQIIA